MPAPPRDPLADEQRYLADARRDLAQMRERVLSLEAVGGDAISDGYLAATLAARARSLVDNPDTPLFFGRTDTAEGQWYVGRRHVQDDGRRAEGGRLAGRRLPAVLPGHAHRADGCLAAPPVRLRPRHPHGVRGRAPHRPRRGRAAQRHPGRGDPAAAQRTDARHRRHDPAGAGRRRPRRHRRDRVRPGRPRHRQDRRRPAPRGLPALRAPRAAPPQRRPRRRPEPLLPLLHRAGPPGPRRVRRRADHRRRADRRTPCARDGPAELATLKGDARMAEVLRRAVWSQVDAADRAARRAGRVASVAGVGQPGHRRPRRPAGEGRPVRLRPQPAGPAARPRGPRADGARGGDHRRPRPGPGRPPSRHEGLRRHGLAGGRRRPRSSCACSAIPTSWRGTPRGILTTDEVSALCWTAPARGPKTAPWTLADAVLVDEVADLSTARRASATSSSTRRRTSPPCSCAPSVAGARPGPPPSSETSPRARPPGRRPAGQKRCPTWGNPRRTWRS